jgi:hypothetical protein
VIFALASWSEIVTGKAISNAACQKIYREVLAKYNRPPGSGMTFAEGFAACPREWFPGRTRITRASLAQIGGQPLLAGYRVTPAWDRPNKAGCLNHRVQGPSRGGHAVVVVGYGGLAKFPGEWVWIENSWGLRWGWKGIGVMGAGLHNQLCTEMWAVV